jgi:hypothetical protein
MTDTTNEEIKADEIKTLTDEQIVEIERNAHENSDDMTVTLCREIRSLRTQLAAAKQTAEAAIRRERIGLATAPVPRARRP